MTSIPDGQKAPSLAAGQSTAPARPALLRAQAALEHLRSEPAPAVDLAADMAAMRKAFARERAAQIKDQLRQLSIVSAVSPKAAARLFGQLSRQLTQATEDYAKAGPDSPPQDGPAPSADNPYPVPSTPHYKADRDFFTFASGLDSQLDAFLGAALSRAKAEEGVDDPLLTGLEHKATDDRRRLHKALNQMAFWHMPTMGLVPTPPTPGPVDLKA